MKELYVIAEFDTLAHMLITFFLASMMAMLVADCVSLLLAPWDLFIVTKPVSAAHFLRNRLVVLTSSMSDNVAKNLPLWSVDQRACLFGSITDVLTYHRGDPVREGVISGTFNAHHFLYQHSDSLFSFAFAQPTSPR